MVERAVLLIDDDPGFRKAFRGLLAPRGLDPICCANAEEGLALFERRHPPLTFLDVLLPGMSGLDLLREIKRCGREASVVMVSGHQDTGTVVQAMRLGASDFLLKPIPEEALCRVLAQLGPSAGTPAGRPQPQPPAGVGGMVGESAFIRRLVALIDQVADTGATILLQGESGVGKGMVARAIHDRSQRRGHPFVKVNCAALPAELLEAELFGFERGAFTGAVRGKPGKFELGHRGTLFLDEVGELSLALQAKLLHVLQDTTFSRLGGEVEVHADVRIIAASNQNLEMAVEAGTLRPDLYFRLNVVNILIPPLRERQDEIPTLTQFFYAKFCKQYSRPLPPLEPRVIQTLLGYRWPGNIRELENAVKRIVLLGAESGLAPLHTARPEDAPAATTAERPTSLKDVSRRAVREVEGRLILEALRATHWNRREAARRLGVSYKALLYKIRAYDLAHNP
jgi:DNA-binding NtrC family response regulator